MSRILKIIKEKRNGRQHFSSPPLVVPVGAVVPETANQTMARLMLSSGVISRDDYEKMLGVRYDIDNDEGVVYEEDAYDYEDDFKLSEWSEYEREDFDASDSHININVRDAGPSTNLGISDSNNEVKEKGTGASEDGKEKEIERSSNEGRNSTAS